MAAATTYLAIKLEECTKTRIRDVIMVFDRIYKRKEGSSRLDVLEPGSNVRRAASRARRRVSLALSRPCNGSRPHGAVCPSARRYGGAREGKGNSHRAPGCEAEEQAVRSRWARVVACLQTYHNAKDAIIKYERDLLRAFGFIVHCDHPHKLLINFAVLLKGGEEQDKERDEELLQTAWNIANDRCATPRLAPTGSPLGATRAV